MNKDYSLHGQTGFQEPSNSAPVRGKLITVHRGQTFLRFGLSYFYDSGIAIKATLQSKGRLHHAYTRAYIEQTRRK